MWELDHKEDWVPKNWCFQTVILEKTLESPLDCKEIKPVRPKGNQPWIFTGRTHAEAEGPILWPPDVKSQFIGKDPGAGKDWRQEEKKATEDKMVGRHHRLNGHEFEQALGDGEGQGSLACCNVGWQRVRHDWAPEQQHRAGQVPQLTYGETGFLQSWMLRLETLVTGRAQWLSCWDTHPGLGVGWALLRRWAYSKYPGSPRVSFVCMWVMGEDAESLDVLESVVFQAHLSPLNPSLGSDHCLPSLHPSKTVLVVLHLLPASLPALQHQKDEQLLPLCSCFSSIILSPPAFGMSSSISKLQGSGSHLTQDLQCQHSPLDLAHSLFRWMKWKIVHGQRQSTLVFLPGKSHEQRNLEAYSPWSRERVRNNLATEITTTHPSRPSTSLSIAPWSISFRTMSSQFLPLFQPTSPEHLLWYLVPGINLTRFLSSRDFMNSWEFR